MKTRIIALFGWKGSGKDTVADIIEHKICDYEYTFHLSFAEPIYDIAKTTFPSLSRQGVFNDANKNRPNRILSQIFKQKNMTGRDAIIAIGENMKQLVNENVWAKNMCARIKNMVYNNEHSPEGRDLTIIISDVRYKTEIKALQSLQKAGYEVEFYAVVRKEAMPDWVKVGLNPAENWELEIIKKDFEVDRSEYEWYACNPKMKAIIPNDGTIEELETTVKNIIKR